MGDLDLSKIGDFDQFDGDDNGAGVSVVNISHLRECLGVAYMHVANSSEPVIVQRYGKADVALVPLWEWRWLKQLEDAIRDGRIDASEFFASLGDAEDFNRKEPH
ncbi:MAG: hypothetical protein ACK5Q5_01200 [Planctomycetaceae bacterium]